VGLRAVANNIWNKERTFRQIAVDERDEDHGARAQFGSFDAVAKSALRNEATRNWLMWDRRQRAASGGPGSEY